MKSWIFYLPFIVQGLVIGFDEFYFHVKRGLPRWERVGHPIDTLSILICLLYVLLFPFSKTALISFLILGVISCLLVTKDEFVHKEHCEASEQWLHALLFINHPLVLFSMGWLWAMSVSFKPFLWVQFCFVSVFCLYQVIYWNVIWKAE